MSAIRQVLVRDGKVSGFQTGMDYEQGLVLPVPELVWGLREGLRDASRAEEEEQAEDTEQSTWVH